MQCVAIHLITKKDCTEYILTKFDSILEHGVDNSGTPEEHHHYLVKLRLLQNGAPQYRRDNIIRGYRLRYGCVRCKGTFGSKYCEGCGDFMRWIYIRDSEHLKNTRKYIQKKEDGRRE